MNLKNAVTLEKSLRGRAGSLSDLSYGRTTRRHNFGRENYLEIPDHLRDEFQELAGQMSQTARKLQNAIDSAMRKIEVDI